MAIADLEGAAKIRQKFRSLASR